MESPPLRVIIWNSASSKFHQLALILEFSPPVGSNSARGLSTPNAETPPAHPASLELNPEHLSDLKDKVITSVNILSGYKIRNSAHSAQLPVDPGPAVRSPCTAGTAASLCRHSHRKGCSRRTRQTDKDALR